MAKVGVHFKNAFIVAFKSPLKASHVCGAKTHLTLTADQVYAGILLGFFFDHIARTIGTAIVDHQDFKAFVLFKNRRHNEHDVFFLIIGRNNYKTFRVRHKPAFS